MTLPDNFKFRCAGSERLYTATACGEDYQIDWEDDSFGTGVKYRKEAAEDKVNDGNWLIEQTQAQKNGWPAWDELPDEFLMYPGAGINSAHLYKRTDDENFICKYLKPSGDNKDSPDTLDNIKKYASIVNGWTYQGEHPYGVVTKEKTEAEFHIEEAIRYHESQIEHHNLMIGKYKEKLGG